MPKRIGRSLACLMIIAAVGFHSEAGYGAVAEHRAIRFPVEGPVRYSDDFGAPRSGGRGHEGNDLMGSRLQRLLSAVDGTVTYMRSDGGGTSGNMLIIVDAQGWSYRYMHINNDSPGTDDNLNPLQFAFAAGIGPGAHVWAGQHVAFLGDSGNAEGTAPHLHFEIRRPDGSPISPWASLRIAQGLSAEVGPPPPPPPMPPPPPRPVARPAPRSKARPAAVRRRARRPVKARRAVPRVAKRRAPVRRR